MAPIDIVLTEEMISHASEAVEEVRVHRTQASQIDTLTGLLGELSFAEWFLGDWRHHDVRGTKGRSDFLDRIEIKTSTFPYSDRLNLLVREDYAAKRKPEVYVQTIIDAPTKTASRIDPGWLCKISGWATADEVDQAPLRDFGRKGGGYGGYRCHHIQIRDLRPMTDFPIARPTR